MAGPNTTICATCNKTFPVEMERCPYCRTRNALSRRAGAAAGVFGSPVALLVIIVLVGILFFVVYRYFFAGNIEVPVETGYKKHCPIDGEDYDVRIDIQLVPRTEAHLYRVVVEEKCPPEVVLGSVKPKLRDLNGIVDLGKLGLDEKEVKRKGSDPDWDPVAEWLASNGRLAVGMTKGQVRATWGEPLGEEFYAKNRKLHERWYYGDPLYGILISRYVDFYEGEVADFMDNELLRILYNEIKLERKHLAMGGFESSESVPQ